MKLFLIVTTFLFASVKGESQIICIEKGEDQRRVSLVCPVGTVLRVEESLLGRSQLTSFKCYYAMDHCTRAKNDVVLRCCGRNQCHFSVGKELLGICGYSTFYKVIYKCVEADEAECGDGFEWDTDVGTRMAFPDLSTNIYPEQIQHIVEPRSSGPPDQHDQSNPRRQNMDHISDKSDDTDLVIIIGSAVAVAFLLASIVLVIFLLQRFKWQNEKECIFQLFIGLCKRQPPDGCENPDADRNNSPRYDPVVMHTTCRGQNPKDLRHNRVADPNTENNQHVVNCQGPESMSDHNITTDYNEATHRQISSCLQSTVQNKKNQVTTKQNDYVDFGHLITDKYSNPVLKTMASKRVVLDQKMYNSAYIVSEEPGTTAV